MSSRHHFILFDICMSKCIVIIILNLSYGHKCALWMNLKKFVEGGLGILHSQEWMYGHMDRQPENKSSKSDKAICLKAICGVRRKWVYHYVNVCTTFGRERAHVWNVKDGLQWNAKSAEYSFLCVLLLNPNQNLMMNCQSRNPFLRGTTT